MGKTKLSSARGAALAVLDEVRRRDGFARDILDAHSALARLDPRDASLVRRLVLGVTASQGCLDELLDRFLVKPRKVAPRVRIALRIAAFEILYLDTPNEVAVSQGVELARSAQPASAGFANAVLRKVAACACAYLAAADASQEDGPLAAKARQAGLPLWLAREIKSSLGVDRAFDLFAAELDPAPVAAYVRASEPDRALPVAGSSPLLLPGCCAPIDIRAVQARYELERASAIVADCHAQLIATAATRAGSCLEVGAGRGTKTYIMMSQASRAGFTHGHVALDLYEGKGRQNLDRLKRAGIEGARAVTGDACALDEALAPLDAGAGERRLFNTVFVDAPCSGTGTMRRHPEIPWRLTPADIQRGLPELQLAMLKQASTRVAPGGELFYATCSVLRQENKTLVEAFLSSDTGGCFTLVPVSEAAIFHLESFESAGAYMARYESADGLFQTIPAPGGFDGHFCARFVRVG